MAAKCGAAFKAAAPTLKVLGKVAKPVAALMAGLDILGAYEKGGVKAAKRQIIISGSSIAGGAAAGAVQYCIICLSTNNDKVTHL